MAQRIIIEGKPVENKLTEYIERVAILDEKGNILLSTPEMMLLNPAELRFMATQLKGRVGWKKFEVTLTELKNRFCEHHDCWSLAEEGSHYCYEHFGA